MCGPAQTRDIHQSMSKREREVEMLCGDERCDGCEEKASLKLRAKNLAGTSEAELLNKIWREAEDP